MESAAQNSSPAILQETNQNPPAMDLMATIQNISDELQANPSSNVVHPSPSLDAKDLVVQRFPAQKEQAAPPPAAMSALARARMEKKIARKKRRAANKKSQIPICRVCLKTYNNLLHRRTYLMAMKCGHMICKPCSRQVNKKDLKNCPTCNRKNMIYSVHRVYL